jgi:hypothetical protein
MLVKNPVQQPDDSKRGFPGPGIQQPRPEEVVTNAMFLNNKDLNELKVLNDYDIVVIGSGCTALAFISEALKLNPYKKILCLERGGMLFLT